MIDSEDKIYDIRKLSAGGWNSSKISVQSYGRWLQFSDCNNVINPTLPINYTKKYKPPKICKKNVSKQNKGSNNDLQIKAYEKSPINTNNVSIIESQKVIVPPIELSPERVAMIVNEDYNRSDPFISNTSRPNANSESIKYSQISNIPIKDKPNMKTNYNVNSQNKALAKDNITTNPIVTHKIIFDDAEFPQTERIIRKRKGEDAKKSFGAYHSRKHTSFSDSTKIRSKTSFKPQKKYVCEYNDDSRMIVYGYRPKTSFNIID